MHIQSSLKLQIPPRPAEPEAQTLRPKNESWVVNDQEDLSTADVLTQTYDGPTEATYSFAHRRPVLSEPKLLIGSPAAGAMVGVVLSPFVMATGLISGVSPSISFGASVGLGAVMGLGAAVYENLPTLHSGKVDGYLQTTEAGTEFQTQDPQWKWDSSSFSGDISEVPTPEFFAEAEQRGTRTISLEQYAQAEPYNGDPKDARQWWNQSFDGNQPGSESRSLK